MAPVWNGSFATEKLNIATPQTKEFENLLGVALRKNPKRAHLLVSKALGKHYPQSPSTIAYAAALLSKQILELEELPSPDISFEELISCLEKNKPTPMVEKVVLPAHDFVVFGYAETATSLGACVADVLDANYVHSTRYPDEGSVNYGSFEEEHSHATSHYITPSDKKFFDEKVVVLVDDELTTGKTILNTITMFEAEAHHDVYYVATLTDLRTNSYKEKFHKFCRENNVDVRVVSLLAAEVVVPENAVQLAEPVLAELKTLAEPEHKGRGDLLIKLTKIETPQLRNGINEEDFDALKEAAVEASKYVLMHPSLSRILVLGNEEDTYFPLLVAEQLQLKGAEVKFSSTTRSPVVSYDNTGYAIRHRITYLLDSDENQKRYAYNIEPKRYDKIVLVTNNARETSQLSRLLRELLKIVPSVEIIERKN